MDAAQRLEASAPPRKTYAYPGGTFHLSPWGAYLAGLTWLWLYYQYAGGLKAFASLRGSVWIGFSLVWFSAGLATEWAVRDQPGRIDVDAKGLTCTLPWGRRRHLRWEDLREVRCTSRRWHPSISFWEVRGLTPQDRITFTWELKGHQELLRTIGQYAPHLARFDAQREDMILPDENKG